MTREEFYSIRKKIIENDFQSLNNMQKKAVFSTEGPLLVLAGAGSGKTTVLVNRIANLIKYGKAYYSTESVDITEEEAELLGLAADGVIGVDIDYLLKVYPVNPWQILAITFTNKAATELKNRLVNMLGEEASEIWASTFHSACVRILRRGAVHLGYSGNFTIYDTDDSKRVIKDCLKQLQLSDKIIAPKTVMFEISNAKNNEVNPDEYFNENQNDYLKKNVAEIYKLYQEKLKAADAMDFDDIIYNTVKLFRQNPEILEYYQNKFKYILVDEYQDTNHLQYVLVSQLAAKYRNLCVVGDDDQSIYRFRGATIENILNFENEYTDAKVIRLEQNYRSTQNILDAANAVIKNNQGRKGKELWTDNGEGSKIIRHEAESDREEAYFVAKYISKGISKGSKASDFAILYRMNSMSNLVEQELIKASIPYKIIGGHKFYDRKEIKDAMSYLCVIANPNDTVRLSRIINEPKRGIGESSFALVQEISENTGVPIIEVMLHADDYPRLSRASKKLIGFAQMINGFRDYAETASISELLSEVLHSTGYIDSLDLEPERKVDRLENLDQLNNNIISFEENTEDATLLDFLQEVALLTDLDSYNSDQDSVILMTIHAAKGLEFNTVFLVGMEESIFPSDMSVMEGDIGVEEERRLAYVAITRAKKALYITNARTRMLFGRTSYNPLSRFVEEIPKELTERSEENKRETQKPKQYSSGGYSGSYSEKKQISSNAKPASSNSGFSGFNKKKPVSSGETYKVGDTVISSTFGEGVILSVKPMAGDCLLEVAFLEGKTKKIMANYAKLQKKNS